MADLDRIRRNVKRMVDQGAPEGDIDDYLRSENVTASELRSSRRVPQTADARETGTPTQDEPNRQLRRVANRFSFGLLNYPMDAWTAFVRSQYADSPGFRDEYRQQRELTRQAIETGTRGTAGTIADLAADTAGYTGQMLASAPLFVARTGSELARGGLQAAQAAYARLFGEGASLSPAEVQAAMPAVNQLTRAQIGRESGRIGGAFGVAEGYGNAPDDMSTADVLVRMGEHGTAGYAIGRALPGAINLVDDYVARPVRNALMERGRARAQRAQDIAGEFEAAGVPVYPPALAGDLTQGTASGLAGTVFGSSVRRGAGESIEAVERRVVEELQAAGGGRVRTPQEAGEEAQDFLRDQLVRESIPRETIEGMTPQQLHDISGVAPGPDVKLKPPRVAPVEAEHVPPLTTDDYLRQVAEQTPEVPPRPVEDVVPQYQAVQDPAMPPAMVEQQRKLSANIATTANLHNRMADEYERLLASLDPFKEPIISPSRGTTLGYRYADNEQVRATRARMNAIEAETKKLAEQHAALVAEREGLLTRYEAMRPELIRQQQGFQDEMARIEAARATEQARRQAQEEAARATEEARRRAVNEARPRAEADAQRRTAELQREADEAAAVATRQRQIESDQAFLADLDARKARVNEPFVLGRSRESYPTEIAAAKEQIVRNTPNVQRNILGDREGRPRTMKVPKPRNPDEPNFTPDEIEAVVEQWRYVRERRNQKPPETLTAFLIRRGGIQDKGTDVRHLMGGVKSRPGLVSARGQTLDDAALAAQEAGYFPPGERPTINDLLNAIDDDLRGNPQVRIQDGDWLDDVRVTREMENDLDKLGVMSAKTEDEVRAALRPGKPEMQTVEVPGAPGSRTNTLAVLEDFALEARGSAQLPGYKGDIFDEAGRIRPDLAAYLRTKLGPDVMKRLEYYAERRAQGRQFVPGIQGLQDIRTAIGRTIREIRKSGRSGYSGTPRSEDDAMLSRLYDALDKDIADFARGAGEAGRVARQQREQFDAAYKEYVNDIRAPLAKVFGEKVDSVSALKQLQAAAKQGGNADLLRSFYRVVGDKGDQVLATSWILNDMAQGGLEGFLKSYRALSPDARRIMFQGPARSLGQQLDRLASVGGKLERVAKVARDDYGKDLSRFLRPGNLSFGLLYTISLPVLIKTAIGAELTARLLASKSFATWLQRMPVERAPKSGEWRRHMNRFRNLAVTELGLTEAAANQILSVVSPAEAGDADYERDLLEGRLPDQPGEIPPQKRRLTTRREGEAVGRWAEPRMAPRRPLPSMDNALMRRRQEARP